MTVVSFRAARKRSFEAQAAASADLEISAPAVFGRRAAPRGPFTGATILVEEDGTYRCCEDARATLVSAGLFEQDRAGALAIRPRGAIREKIERLTRAARGGERPTSILCRDAGATYSASAGAVPLGGQAIVALEIRPVSPPEWSNRDLADHFGLTEREAEVTRHLLHGHPVTAIAARLQVRATTVRQYLKLIYGKTATSGQAQLVALLTGGFRGDSGCGTATVSTMEHRS
jgi:DNA-binding CsgD family transcriptional regulator